VLLLGGSGQNHEQTSAVRLVDLATGVCTPQAPLLHARRNFAAARLPDGRVVCAGSLDLLSTAEAWGPPLQGAQDAAWTWKVLPPMSAGRLGCQGCVLSDGRFVIIGGSIFNSSDTSRTSSCEVLSFGDDGAWRSLPPMHDSRSMFVCAAVARCIIVAGGGGPHDRSAEIFDEELGRWLWFPCDLPRADGLLSIGSALLLKNQER
jgi:hypothetical protein